MKKVPKFVRSGGDPLAQLDFDTFFILTTFKTEILCVWGFWDSFPNIKEVGFVQGKGKVFRINELSVVYFPYQENCHDQCLCLTLFATLANLPLLGNFPIKQRRTDN